MADHDGNHRCHEEKNVLIAFILPSRWQVGVESLGIEHKLFMATSCSVCSAKSIILAKIRRHYFMTSSFCAKTEDVNKQIFFKQLIIETLFATGN